MTDLGFNRHSKPVKKVGAFCWLSLAICIVELLICMKFGHGELPLFNFLVRYSTDNPVCDDIVDKKGMFCKLFA